MKNNLRHFSLVLAAGLAGAAALSLGNSELFARLPLDIILAASAAVGVILIAIADYTPRVAPLTRPARLLRPMQVPARPVRSAVASRAA